MKAPFEWPFYRLSWYSHIALVLYLLLFFVIRFVDAGRPQTVGLKIRLLRPGIEGERSPGIQPLRVHVAWDNQTFQPIVTVNFQPVPWQDFATVLRRELRLCPPDWPVYLDGDRDMEWGHAVRAMDVILGLHAQVVLLTR